MHQLLHLPIIILLMQKVVKVSQNVSFSKQPFKLESNTTRPRTRSSLKLNELVDLTKDDSEEELSNQSESETSSSNLSYVSYEQTVRAGTLTVTVRIQNRLPYDLITHLHTQ